MKMCLEGGEMHREGNKKHDTNTEAYCLGITDWQRKYGQKPRNICRFLYLSRGSFTVDFTERVFFWSDSS